MKDKDYQKALKREADRERKFRMSEQGAFESSFCHIDLGAEDSRECSPSWLSDGGKGAAAIFKHYDEADRKRKIDAALKHLSPKDRAFAEAILDGKTWREMGYDEKSYFYKRLKKICKKISGKWPLTPSKRSLDR